MQADIRGLLPNAYFPFFSRFPSLRPAQEETIPLVVSGKNVLLISPTGSGKTEAIIAPVAEAASRQKRHLTCIYICPTRALVNDIERRIKDRLERMGLKVGVRHGDRKTMQGNRLPEILITTPESLDVMLGKENFKERLAGVQTVIVDEVHQFYQTHRGYQLTLLLERLKWWTKAPLQRLLLSATVAEPEAMGQWFQGSDQPYQLVRIPGTRALDVKLTCVTAESSDAFKTGESVAKVMQGVMSQHNKVLLFANSRNECNWLAWKLGERLQVPTLLHYSSLDRTYREKVERRFQAEPRVLCVATSTLELGVDIGDVDAVVMYGAPASISSFVQRVGRGNRRQDISHIYGLCRDYHVNGAVLGAEQDTLLFLALVNSMQVAELESQPRTTLYSVLAQQLFSLTWRWGSIIPDKLVDALEAGNPHPFADKEDLSGLLDHLVEKGFYTRRTDTNEYYKTEKWEWLLRSRQLWGNIASQASDTVYDAPENVPLADIPRGQAETGRIMLLVGQPRLVTEVEGPIVQVVPLDMENPEFIAYETTGAATPLEVTTRVGALLCDITFPDLPLTMDDASTTTLRSYRQRFRDFPIDQAVPHDQTDGKHCYYTFGGTWVHVLLALALRQNGYRIQHDVLRIYANKPIGSFEILPTSPEELVELVAQNLETIQRLMALSYHFYQLPEARRLEEVCSLMDLPRIADWFAELRTRLPQPLPNGGAPSASQSEIETQTIPIESRGPHIARRSV